jgi:hypothetical protein
MNDKTKQLNKERHSEYVKQWKEFIRESGYACSVCGFNNPTALIFSPREEKVSVSKLIHSLSYNSNNVAKVIEAINKCDILCANCRMIQQ